MLSEKAQILQNVLAFFDPNSVLERLILKSKAPLSEDKLMFLFNESEYVMQTFLAFNTMLTLV